MAKLTFQAGTLVLTGVEQAPEGFAWDARAAAWRAPGSAYAGAMRELRERADDVEDGARRFGELAHGAVIHREARPYQREALEAWERRDGRGVVVLPTGAGKTHVALMAIDARRVDALVVAPTLDLVRQWYDLLRVTFGLDVGVVGGGEHRVMPLTVATYDSACLHMEHLGARFGLVVFDECHHLPGPSYALAARLCIAPYRLGLTATKERADGKHAELDELVGPTVYAKPIGELSGDWLAEYDTQRIEVDLHDDEREEHDAERKLYLAFAMDNGIRLASPRGFQDFVMRSARSASGRRAMRAYRRQREIAFAARGKLDYLEVLLGEHRAERTIVFTEDNATAYRVARRFLVPAITHQTKVTERSEILEGFAKGRYGVVVTSKVLNEGVDVPEASVAVVLSGSGSVREHVQRLGRILRKSGDKRATLYELVTKRTAETGTSQRRREHDAYR